MLHCRKCNGRVFIDRAFSTQIRLEIYCINCGKRWFVKRDENAFGIWLSEKEKKFEKKFGTSL